MLTQCLEIKARGCCMHVFLVKHYIGGENELKKNAEPSSSDSVSRSIIHRNLTMKTFLKQADNNDTALCWQKYKKEIERQFRLFGITSLAAKILSMPTMLFPTSIEGDDVYKVLIWKIDQHFIPK